MQVTAKRIEESVGHRHHPVVTALALGDEYPPISDLNVGVPQPEHLAPTQPTEQHRRHHRPVAMRAQRRDQPVRLGRRQDSRQRAGHPHQRRQPRLACAALAAGGQPTRHRIPGHSRVAARDCVRVETRHRRQSPGDRARRQTGLPIAQPNHGAVAALLREELEHVSRRDISRVLPDNGEERLQIERNRPKRVRPSPARNELQIPIDQRMTEPIPHPAQHTRRAHQQRETSHDRTLAAPEPTARYDTNLTGVLGDLGAEGGGREARASPSIGAHVARPRARTDGSD